MQAFRKSMLIALVLAALLAACAPAQSQEQIQSQVQTSVAMTVEAQNQIGTFVAQTVEAQSPAAQATATSAPTETPVPLPTLTPVIISTPTAYAVAPSGGSGSGGSSGSSPATGQAYHCSVVGQTPNDNSPATILKTGDKLDVHWTILNDGTKTWDAGSPWQFYSSSIDSNVASDANLPIITAALNSGLASQVKPGDNVTLGMELTAPSSFASRNPIHITYYYVLILEGSKKICHPWINVEILRPGMTP